MPGASGVPSGVGAGEGEGVGVGEELGELPGEGVGVGEGEGEGESCGEAASEGEGDGVCVPERAALPLALPPPPLGLPLGALPVEREGVGEGVSDCVRVRVMLLDALPMGLLPAESEAVAVAVGEGERERVGVIVGEDEGERVRLLLCVGDTVGVAVDRQQGTAIIARRRKKRMGRRLRHACPYL